MLHCTQFQRLNAISSRPDMSLETSPERSKRSLTSSARVLAKNLERAASELVERFPLVFRSIAVPRLSGSALGVRSLDCLSIASARTVRAVLRTALACGRLRVYARVSLRAQVRRDAIRACVLVRECVTVCPAQFSADSEEHKMIADKKVKLGKYTAKQVKLADIALGRIAVVGWYDAEPERGVIVHWDKRYGGAGQILVICKKPYIAKFDGADQIIELEGFITI